MPALSRLARARDVPCVKPALLLRLAHLMCQSEALESKGDDAPNSEAVDPALDRQRMSTIRRSRYNPLLEEARANHFVTLPS
jgi:hypothetical protein